MSRRMSRNQGVRQSLGGRLPVSRPLRSLSRLLFAGLLLLQLAACASNVTRSTGSGYSQPYFKNTETKAGKLTVTLTPEGRKLAGENLSFNHEKLRETVRRALELHQILSAELGSRRPSIEIQITSVRARSSFSAVMFGFMAGDDHINGNVIVRNPIGAVLQRFAVSASYALGGLAGGQESTRMGWLYETFAKHVVQELTGKSEENDVARQKEVAPVSRPQRDNGIETEAKNLPRTSANQRLAALSNPTMVYKDGRYSAVTFGDLGNAWKLQLNVRGKTVWGEIIGERCDSCPGSSANLEIFCARQSVQSLSSVSLSCVGGGTASRGQFHTITGSLSNLYFDSSGYEKVAFTLLNESDFQAYQRFAANNRNVGTDKFVALGKAEKAVDGGAQR